MDELYIFDITVYTPSLHSSNYRSQLRAVLSFLRLAQAQVDQAPSRLAGIPVETMHTM